VTAIFGTRLPERRTIEAQRVIALYATFTFRRFSVTVHIEPAVFMPLADAWRAAGLPAELISTNTW
jgi:hypothetical protein